MDLVNTNISPLPFYDDILQQNHRKPYAYGQVWPLIIYKNMLVPFQAVLAGGTSIITVRLHQLDRPVPEFEDITSVMLTNGLKVTAYEGFSILKYPGRFPINPIKFEGQYYLAINIAGLGWIYSDVFCRTNNIDGYVKLTYKNSFNLNLSKGGFIDFSDSFSFKCYVHAQIGKPEYSFDEEATERMGFTFIESQVSKKIFKFGFAAPEYLCDALRIVRLCDTKTIEDNLNSYDATTFSMDVNWEEQGDIAGVQCEFETDTVIAAVGGYKPLSTGKDFNTDFNNDFN